MPEYVAWLTHPDNRAAASATAITVTGAASGYPGSNLKTLPITETWRSADLTAVQNLDADLGSALAVNFAAIVNHNLSQNATIQLYADDNASFTSPNVSETIPYREFLAFKRLSASQTYRYWRVRIDDTGNADGYNEVGYLMLGSLTEPGFNFQNGWIRSPVFTNLEVASPYGVPFVEEMHREQLMRFSFGPLTAAEMTTLRTMYTTVRGPANPLAILPERDQSDAYFGRILSLFDERVESQRYTNIEFFEDSYGRRI